VVRLLHIGLAAVLALALSASASASWTSGGSGSGTGAAAAMPAGLEPSASAAGHSVTVTWTQSPFLGSPLGSYSLGGYIKDVDAPPLTAAYSGGPLGLDPKISGASECGAGVRALETSGSHPGRLYPTAGPFVIASGTAYSFGVEGPPLLGTVYYDVTATDRAGNASAAVTAHS
jgi:hypothetical protein